MCQKQNKCHKLTNKCNGLHDFGSNFSPLLEEFWQTTKCFLAICIGKQAAASTVKKGFQETHHHANCDRNGNELSNPRTMKMVTSIAWKKNRKRRRVIPFSQIALLHASTGGKTKANRGSKSNYSFSCLLEHLHVLLIGTTKLEVKRDTIAGKRENNNRKSLLHSG